MDKIAQKGITSIALLLVAVITFILVGGYIFLSAQNPEQTKGFPEVKSQQIERSSEENIQLSQNIAPRPTLSFAPPGKASKKASEGEKEVIQKVCKETLYSHNPDIIGITFEESYCQGDLCRIAQEEAICESLDVIKVDSKMIFSGNDGVADCHWVQYGNTKYCSAHNLE